MFCIFVCLFLIQLLVIRGSLFPETLEENLYPSSKLNDEDDEDVSMQSINQILQDLSNNNPDDQDDADILLKNINDDEDDVGANTPFSFDDDDEDILLSDSTKRTDIKLKLTQELQVYRNIHHNKIPYDQWSDDYIKKCDPFFNDFILFFVTPYQREHLDQRQKNVCWACCLTQKMRMMNFGKKQKMRLLLNHFGINDIKHQVVKI